MKLQETCEKIKNLEIQGATNIAKSGLTAIAEYAQDIKAETRKEFLSKLEKAKKMLFLTRPTEPLLRNCINYFIFMLNGENVQTLKSSAKWAYAFVSAKIQQAEEEVVKNTAKIIKNNSVVYTHCHSSSVTRSIILAAKTKNILVNNTETRPRMQGRITAEELAKAGIKVKHYVDSAAKFAISNADIMLIGADAITACCIYNKVGSDMFAEEAKRLKVPVYVSTIALKIDPETLKGKKEVIEFRDKKEVWENSPMGVEIINPAFSAVNIKLVNAIISELGILKPKTFFKAAKKAYPWLFK